jgi:hypothetical protein
LHIKILSKSINEQQIREIFSPFGEIYGLWMDGNEAEIVNMFYTKFFYEENKMENALILNTTFPYGEQLIVEIKKTC